MSSLEKALEEWSPTIYPAFIPRIKGRERIIYSCAFREQIGLIQNFSDSF